MESHIPSHFDNFEQRMLARGLETKSTTSYKGYLIILRCYKDSGISAKIIKKDDNGKNHILREKIFNFMDPLEFLNKQKNYIDEYGSRLETKFEKCLLKNK